MRIEWIHYFLQFHFVSILISVGIVVIITKNRFPSHLLCITVINYNKCFVCRTNCERQKRMRKNTLKNNGKRSTQDARMHSERLDEVEANWERNAWKYHSVRAWNPKRLQMCNFVTFVSVCDFSHQPRTIPSHPDEMGDVWESDASICVAHRPPSNTNITHMPVMKMEYFPPAPRCILRYLIETEENGFHLSCTHDRILRSEMSRGRFATFECSTFFFLSWSRPWQMPWNNGENVYRYAVWICFGCKSMNSSKKINHAKNVRKYLWRMNKSMTYCRPTE